MSKLLAALEAGAMTWAQLRHVIGSETLLEVLVAHHESHRRIMRRWPKNGGPVLFAKFAQDTIVKIAPVLKPKRPRLRCGPEKVCATCGKHKFLTQFGSYRKNGALRPSCYSCGHISKRTRDHFTSPEHIHGASNTGRDSYGRHGDGEVPTGAV